MNVKVLFSARSRGNQAKARLRSLDQVCSGPGLQPWTFARLDCFTPLTFREASAKLRFAAFGKPTVPLLSERSEQLAARL